MERETTPPISSPSESLDRFFDDYATKRKAVSEAKGRTSGTDRGLESALSKMRSTITVWKRSVGDEWPTNRNIGKFRVAAREEPGWGADYVRTHEGNVQAWKTWLRDSGVWNERVEFQLTAPGGPINRKAIKDAKPNEHAANAVGGVSKLASEDIDAIAAKTASDVYTMLFGPEASQDFWAVLLRRLSHALGPRNLAKALGVENHIADAWIRNGRVPAQARISFHHAWIMLSCKEIMEEKGWDGDDLEDAVLDFGKFVLEEDARQ